MKYNKNLPYIRVGTSYFKIVNRPLLSKDYLETLIKWDRKSLVDDFDSGVLKKVPKYDGFCNIPSHIDFQQEVGTFLNRYDPLVYEPSPGGFSSIEYFLKHVFSDQYELALDYLSLLYRKPIQPLPILCLVSKERNTGKTTFLNFLKAIYGQNMTYNKNEDFRNQFNSDWAGKLLIAVDEVLLDKKEDSERIKNLSTSITFKAEAKGVDRSEIEFFGKFILCSNNEDSFIQIDPGETRYWVIKVKPFDKEIVNLLIAMKGEIPAFLYYLKNREIITPNTSRMWFDPKLLRTNALKKVILKHRNRLEIELLTIIQDLMDEFEVNSIEMCNADPLPFIQDSGFKYCNRNNVREIFKDRWGLKPTQNTSSYKKYCLGHNGTAYINTKAKGRFYILKRELIDDLMNY